jgi:5-formyltetrahydrofolate cyclo-ligase
LVSGLFGSCGAFYVIGYSSLANMRDLKASLRSQVREKLNAISPAQRETYSSRAQATLEQHPIWQLAQTILFFAPMPDELDIWPSLPVALDSGKRVFLPRFMPHSNSYAACEVKSPDTDLTIGLFGIREPSESCPQFPLNRLDLVLVPGVAFDLHGRRLGRGKGFYDQLLATVRGRTCGVAFDEQIVNEIPLEPHDVLLNCILTPSRWIQL